MLGTTQFHQTILVIEDNNEDFYIMKRTFAKLNIEVNLTRCADGQEGIDYLKKVVIGNNQENSKDFPCLILLDLNLPRRNGYEVLAFIKSNEQYRFIPVIMLTTSTSIQDINTSYNLGANSYINKPLELDSFVAAVKKLMAYWFETVLLPNERIT